MKPFPKKPVRKSKKTSIVIKLNNLSVLGGILAGILSLQGLWFRHIIRYSIQATPNTFSLCHRNASRRG